MEQTAAVKKKSGARTAKAVIDRWNHLKTERSNWEIYWQDLAELILPNKSNIMVQRTPGDQRDYQVFDNTAIQANELLAGALHGLLTNPYSQWFELTTGNPELDDKDHIRLWLQDTTRRMHNQINDSNFQTEIHEYYLDLGCFGTAPLLMEEDEELVVRFMAIFIGTIYICENNKGMVDEVFRDFDWTARLIVDNFGLEGLPKKIVEAYNKDENTKFKILHAVYPNSNQQESGPLSPFKYISQYVFVDDVADIEVKGFREMPYIVGRWSKTSDEVYGRGPGMAALPETRVVNKMEEMSLYAAAKTIDPPIMLPDDGMIFPAKTGPGDQNFFRAGSSDRIEPIFSENIRLDVSEAIMEKRRERIRQAFYVDQLQLNVGDRATATEASIKNEEKQRLLGPMMGRQQNELLAPMITRLYGIMARKGLLQPAPSEIKSFGVRYSSMIARIQRQAEGDLILKTVQVAAPFIQSDPTVLDNINGDQAIKEIARIYGLPQKMLRNKNEVEDIRKSRAQAQAAQVKAQQEAMQAENINKLAPAMPKIQG